MKYLTHICILACFFSLSLTPSLHAQDSLKTNIVKINIENDLGVEQGTGIVVGQKDNQTYILTAWHVIDEAEKIKVSFFQDKSVYAAKSIRKYDENLDIAIIVAENISLDFLQLPISDTFVPGQSVWTVGHPYGDEWRINYPMNALTKPIYENDINRLTINKDGVNRGSSGGAIYSKEYGLLAMIAQVNSLDAIGIKFSKIKPVLEGWNIPVNYLDGSGVLPGLTKKLFDSDTTYNILLLPFGVLGSCDPDEQLYCERAVANRIVNVSDEQDLNVDVHILGGYNGPGYTLSYKEGRRLGEHYKANLVVWGDYEKVCDWDTTMINIRYVSLDNLNEGFEPTFVGQKGETDYQPIRMLSELSRGKITGDMESLVYWSLGMRETFKGKYAIAIDLLKKIKIKNESEYSLVYLFLGVLQNLEKNHSLALQYYSQAIEINPNDVEAYNNRGFLFQEVLKRPQDAISDYNKVIELNPKKDRVYINRGLVFYKFLERPQDALQDYNKAIELNPKSAEAYNNRGSILDAMNKPQEALSDYNKAIELNSTYTYAYINRGNLLKTMGHPDKALANYNKAIELNPEENKAYYNRGLLFHEVLKRPQNALADYNKVIELNPKEERAYYNRGLLFHDILESPQDALSDYSKVIELNPKEDNAYYNRGNLLKVMGRPEEALSDYNKAIELNPAEADAYYNRGLLLQIMNRQEEALRDFNKLIEIYPNAFPAYLARGRTYLLQEELFLALLDFSYAIRFNPKAVEAYKYRGDVYLKQKKYDLALIDYTNILKYEAKELYPELGKTLSQSAFNPYRQDPRFRQIFELAKE